MMRTWTAVICLLGLVAGAGVARGDILLVPSQYGTIQEAIWAAGPGDEIQIAAGIYDDVAHMANPPDDSTLCVAILTPGITLSGAGMGLTIIDGDSTGRGFYLRDCGPDVEIRDMTFRRAFADDHGAAIFCYDNSSPYIHHVEITGNYDGGLTMTSGPNGGCHPRIEHCVLTDNEAKAGGGLDVEPGCEPYVFDCLIENNRAPFAAGVRMRGSGTMSHCVITNNHTTSSTNVLGGGLLIKDQASPVIRYCEISNNTVYGDGAGVCFEDASGELRRCTITGNRSISALEGHGGGLCVLSQATPYVTGCVITDNSTAGAFSDGGGVWVQYAGILLENCTVYANWTEGVLPDYGNAGNIGLITSLYIPVPIEITRCIATESPQGRGMYHYGGGDPPLINCCDVWGNEGGDEVPVAGTGNFSQDPLYCDAAGGDFHVAEGSPCAAGNHPGGAGTCDDMGIGAYAAGCGTGVEEPPLASDALHMRNHPNPFTDGTTIYFELPEAAVVSLEVFDLTGRTVAVLQHGALPAGPHQVEWNGLGPDGRSAGRGVYFYQLRTGDAIVARRMLHMR